MCTQYNGDTMKVNWIWALKWRSLNQVPLKTETDKSNHKKPGRGKLDVRGETNAKEKGFITGLTVVSCHIRMVVLFLTSSLRENMNNLLSEQWMGSGRKNISPLAFSCLLSPTVRNLSTICFPEPEPWGPVSLSLSVGAMCQLYSSKYRGDRLVQQTIVITMGLARVLNRTF